jgi:HEAT repeat protein
VDDKDKLDTLLWSYSLEKLTDALHSDRSPESEIESLLRLSRCSQPAIQELVLDKVIDLNWHLCAPILTHLATSGINEGIRLRAIQAVSTHRNTQATETLLIGTLDMHPSPQEASILALRHRNDNRIRTILKHLISKPGSNLHESYKSNRERIRTAAAQAIQGHVNKDDIDYLIKIALMFPQIWREIFDALKALELVSASNAIVKLILDGPPEGIPHPDEAFKLDSLIVVASKPPRREKPLERLRKSIAILYPIIVRPNQEIRDSVIKLIATSFDEVVSDSLVKRVIDQSNNVQPGQLESICEHTETILSHIPLELSSDSWFKIIGLPQKAVWSHALEALKEVVGGQETVLSEAVVRSIIENPESSHHNPERIHSLIGFVGKPICDSLTIELLPLLGSDNDAIRAKAVGYLQTCASLLDDDQSLSTWIQMLIARNESFPASAEELARFLARMIDNAPAERKTEFIRVFIDSKDCSAKSMLAAIANSSGKKQALYANLIRSGTGKGKWKTTRSILEQSTTDSAIAAASSYLISEWNSHIWSFLSAEDLQKASEVSRSILAKSDYSIPIKDRARLIFHLGNHGSEDDEETIAIELTSKYPNIRVAASDALGKIGTTTVEKRLWPILEDGRNAVVQSAIQALSRRALPTVETVRRLQERESDDPCDETRILAKEALSTLLSRHLEADPRSNIPTWLKTLEAFGQSDCCENLESLLYSLDDDAELRANVASSIGKCAMPTDGLPLIEKRLSDEPVERNQQVRSALEVASDQLRGSPDTTLLKLLNEALQASIIRSDLLGDRTFDDLFDIPNTSALLRVQLVKIQKDKDNPDAFITRLDGISDFLANEIDDALVREFPETKNESGRRGYTSQIEFMGRVSPEFKAAASNLHELRKKSDLPHVVDETSGKPKPGCDSQDLTDAKRHFEVIIRQVMSFLAIDYEKHRIS